MWEGVESRLKFEDPLGDTTYRKGPLALFGTGL